MILKVNNSFNVTGWQVVLYIETKAGPFYYNALLKFVKTGGFELKKRTKTGKMSTPGITPGLLRPSGLMPGIPRSCSGLRD